MAEHIETGRDMGRRPVFFAMGSSGQPELFRSILGYLDTRTDLQVVVAYTNILRADQLPPVGEHVLLRRLVLAEEVARRVDVAIIHGGHGTVYTQAYSGTPFIGIPMQMEQQYNLDTLVRQGGGFWISKRNFQMKRMEEAINRLIASYDEFKRNAVDLRDRLPPANGAKRSADLIQAI